MTLLGSGAFAQNLWRHCIFYTAMPLFFCEFYPSFAVRKYFLAVPNYFFSLGKYFFAVRKLANHNTKTALYFSFLVIFYLSSNQKVNISSKLTIATESSVRKRVCHNSRFLDTSNICINQYA